MFVKSKALFLIFRKHLTSKWGRVLLAQAGIMIGVWAISLTSSLSLGLSDKIVTAINSQPSSREIQLSKLDGGKTSFFELTDAPKFVMLGKQDFESIQKNIPGIKSVTADATMTSYVKTNKASSEYNCVDEGIKLAKNIKLSQLITTTETDTLDTFSNQQKDLDAKCATLTLNSLSFESYYDSNRTKFIGSQSKPQRGEISICYKCEDLNFNEKIGVTSPADMIGKTIILDIKQTPNYKLAGEIYDTNQQRPTNKDLEKSNPISLKIVSVIDDSKVNNNIFSGGGSTVSWLDFSYFEDSIKTADPATDINKVGYIGGNIVINSYDDLDNVINKLKERKYAPFSASQILIGGIKTLFSVLTYFLAGFGLIALISSIFGIINVMTISVLERRKEIGIIKSLGGDDKDIFVIFLLESVFLGIFGWLFGILLAFGTGRIISTLAINLINSNPEWKENLATFNISEFTPVFPWQLLAITFGLAVFFTSISGLIPSIRAAKQNIVEVLRSE